MAGASHGSDISIWQPNGRPLRRRCAYWGLDSRKSIRREKLVLGRVAPVLLTRHVPVTLDEVRPEAEGQPSCVPPTLKIGFQAAVVSTG
jgi:hypothetical protein